MTDPQWRKASRSNDQSLGCCVECADLGDTIGIRDSKYADGGHLTLSRAAWARLLDTIKETA